MNSQEAVSIEAKLAQDTFKADTIPHIVPDPAVCQSCSEKWCLRLCPAKLYSLSKDGSVNLNFEGCLECGTCLVVCRSHFLQWGYPRAGFGVQFQFG